MWDLPRPGLEPVSPALAGGFLTTAPPGKSETFISEGGRTEGGMLAWMLKDLGPNTILMELWLLSHA